ncbi:alpha/beta hydrolase [Frankia sp. AgB1.9]|nr:alpha/beta hydrolase [Frankia sp. AgW1.1]MBL7552352.1 alpha/beta hydrolase [Frankia sp. AgB1.9]MBL7625485.1 alpha/beta hydrolase [Frankia sp. AgB1.8]
MTSQAAVSGTTAMTTKTPPETVLSVDGGALFVVPGVEPVVTAGSEASGSSLPTEAVDGPPVVVLLHGAGSGTQTPVLRRLAERLGAAGITVARLEMPYRVAGRKAPDRAARLDSVLTAAVEALGRPSRLALAGASMGSRVAVRTARQVGAHGVVALGFPLNPPGDRPSRQGELSGAVVPVLVLQGERDSFGRPRADPASGVQVVVIAGADHSFKVRVRDGRPATEVVDEAAGLATDWLAQRLLGHPDGARG